ncbi:MAG: hypothetical protein H6659_14725 [Ardenticatenaceae bacterium]|nr:hypothetical protein [Anaerolineales bacterium]MCB8985083.1 hypothetical protein [Ardenticatenaceae bacterium]MCB8986748.1 hypothetical protein [Ardenticatenaceae bacterium]
MENLLVTVMGIGLLFAIPAVIILFFLNRANSGKKATFDQFVMRTEVTDKGITVPAYLFSGAQEVEVFQGPAGVLIKIVQPKK